MVEPRVDVLAAFLEDLLSEDDGRRRCIRKEVVLGDVAVIANRSPPVVTQVEYTGLDSEPESAKNASVINSRGPGSGPDVLD